MQTSLAAVGLVTVMAATGCAADETRDVCGLVEEKPLPGFSPSLSAQDFVGKTLEEAEALAERQGGIVRVVGRDGNCEGRSDDLRENRVNVYLEKGRVVAAVEG